MLSGPAIKILKMEVASASFCLNTLQRFSHQFFHITALPYNPVINWLTRYGENRQLDYKGGIKIKWWHYATKISCIESTLKGIIL